MDSNSNTYLYFYVFVLCLLPTDLIGQEFIYQNQTEIIGCGGNEYNGANHTVHFYRAPLYASVILTSCGDRSANTTIYWYAFKDLCRSNTTVNTFFAAVAPDNPLPSNTDACLQRRNITISIEMCKNSFEFTRESMIIKNLTNEIAERYICFRGAGWSTISNSSVVSYDVRIGGKYLSLPSKESDKN